MWLTSKNDDEETFCTCLSTALGAPTTRSSLSARWRNGFRRLSSFQPLRRRRLSAPIGGGGYSVSRLRQGDISPVVSVISCGVDGPVVDRHKAPYPCDRYQLQTEKIERDIATIVLDLQMVRGNSRIIPHPIRTKLSIDDQRTETIRPKRMAP